MFIRFWLLSLLWLTNTRTKRRQLSFPCTCKVRVCSRRCPKCRWKTCLCCEYFWIPASVGCFSTKERPIRFYKPIPSCFCRIWYLQNAWFTTYSFEINKRFNSLIGISRDFITLFHQYFLCKRWRRPGFCSAAAFRRQTTQFFARDSSLLASRYGLSFLCIDEYFGSAQCVEYTWLSLEIPTIRESTIFKFEAIISRHSWAESRSSLTQFVSILPSCSVRNRRFRRCRRPWRVWTDCATHFRKGVHVNAYAG